MITFNNLGRYGRFGNQLWQIASTIGIATKHGYQFGFPVWRNYDQAKFTDEEIDIQDYFVNPLPLCQPSDREHFVHWGYHNLNLEDGISLAGHLQSYKYFEHCKDVVKHFFTMHNDYEQEEVIALHIRLGDYDDFYHPRQKLAYYEKALTLLPKDLPIFIFSDEIEKAKQVFAATDIDQRAVYISGLDYIRSFMLMQKCKHFVIANSTFSWWAAWLGEQKGKRVIAPRNWFGEVAGLHTTDMHPKEWIVV